MKLIPLDLGALHFIHPCQFVKMYNSTRSLSSHMRTTSGAGASAAQSPALVARIEEKKAELEHLQDLKDLSAAVATQMEALEQKLSTLSDGTQGM